MNFATIMKKKHSRLLSKTWRTTLVEREIERNNFHVTGNVVKAREFSHAVTDFKFPRIFEQEPKVVFSRMVV